ncbi:uncharacterized protein LOC143295009 [Babylonia areolata]|uniref:uncharacterized protein LOC143295009 n=1 Tax=Babylonia areolata TaxID=304850 RepID=UPI003FD69B0C
MADNSTATTMAASGANDFCGNWWGGWLQAAKEKSTAALDMVRKDLAEFGCTMQKDTTHAVEVTSTTLKESLKAENTSTAKDKLTKGLSTFLGGISKALVVPPDDEGQIPITASSAELYDRATARLHAVQVDPDTYLQEPDGPQEQYSRWCETFDPDSVKGEISELLVSKAEVRGLYTKLVPSRVSHVDFWRHYFYKRHQMDLDQARKEALMKRAERSRADSSISWEDDWSGDEAMEDSGSDWEKLPRPTQKDQSPGPAVSVGLVAPAAQASPEPPPSQQTTTPSGHAAQSGQEPPHTPAAGAPQDNFHDIALQPATSHVSVSSEQPSAAFVNLHPQAGEPLSALLQEISDHSSPQQKREENSCFSSGASKAGQTSEGHHTGDVMPADPGAFPEGASSLPGHDDRKQTLNVQAENEAVGPVSDQVEPVSGQMGRVRCQEDQTSSGDEPVSSQLESMSSQAEPERNDAEPASGQDEPTANQDEPATSQHEPATNRDEPATRQAQAVAEVASSAIPGQSEAAVLSVTQPVQPDPQGADDQGSMSGTAHRQEGAVSTDQSVAPDDKSHEAASPALDDDWDEDLDLELTEDDMKAAEQLAKTLGENVNLEEDDWENWE